MIKDKQIVNLRGSVYLEQLWSIICLLLLNRGHNDLHKILQIFAWQKTAVYSLVTKYVIPIESFWIDITCR